MVNWATISAVGCGMMVVAVMRRRRKDGRKLSAAVGGAALCVWRCLCGGDVAVGPRVGPSIFYCCLSISQR